MFPESGPLTSNSPNIMFADTTHPNRVYSFPVAEGGCLCPRLYLTRTKVLCVLLMASLVSFGSLTVYVHALCVDGYHFSENNIDPCVDN